MLVVVPTPLGNLGDVTARCLEALRIATLIVAEDTRVARRLLRALHLEGRELWSYREQNSAAMTVPILERARCETVVLTTDAGMPAISDPGSGLIAAARSAGIAVDVLPGPSAVIGAAVLSGFPLQRFSFEGFPPRGGSARRAAFARALRTGTTTVWFEAPHRIVATLRDLAAEAPDAVVFLVREYTKRHEQQVLGRPADVSAALSEPVRGEIAFVIAPLDRSTVTADPAGSEQPTVDGAIDALLAQGAGVSQIAKRLARSGMGERAALYVRAGKRKRAGKGGPSLDESEPR
jgi:16S rRNA (cytidine1402-2'-O)-methyltransferase